MEPDQNRTGPKRTLAKWSESKAMSENKAKKLKEIFSDYETKANIKEAHVTALNVIKKTNTLGIILEIDEYIEVKDIWYFEKFLIERFHFSNIDMTIHYQKDTQLKSIKEEWKNIICYMAHKYPLMKPMLLMKSDVEINDNIINVKMHIRGADFLRAKKTDKELENVIKKLYGKEYKIELEEILPQEAEIQHEKKIKEMEENAIKQTVAFIPENGENSENGQHTANTQNFPNSASNGTNSVHNQNNSQNEVPEYNDPDYMPPQDGDYIPMEEMGTMPEDMELDNAVIEEQKYKSAGIHVQIQLGICKYICRCVYQMQQCAARKKSGQCQNQTQHRRIYKRRIDGRLHLPVILRPEKLRRNDGTPHVAAKCKRHINQCNLIRISHGCKCIFTNIFSCDQTVCNVVKLLENDASK